MIHKPFDTLETYKELVSKGIPHAAAEALCKVHKSQHDGVYDQFVGKDDLENIVVRIFRKQIAYVIAMIAGNCHYMGTY